MKSLLKPLPLLTPEQIIQQLSGSEPLLKDFCAAKGIQNFNKAITRAQRDGCLSLPEARHLASENRFEDHEINTPSGRILHIHRIAHPEKPPVLIGGGVFTSSLDWLDSSGGSLATYLHSQGFDVWLANRWGSDFSCKTSRSMTRNEYWNWTFMDMGREALPAMTSHILKETGFAKLSYIGHSAGTIEVIAGLLVPTSTAALHDRLNLVCFLSPAVPPGPVKDDDAIVYELFMAAKFALGAVGTISPNVGIEQSELESHLMDLLAGDDETHSAEQQRCQWMHMDAEGAMSLKALNHVFQHMPSPSTYDIHEFDYGPAGNLEMYGKPAAPSFNLASVKVPIAVMSAALDPVVGQPLYRGKALRDVNRSFIVFNKTYPKYNHNSWYSGRVRDANWFGFDLAHLLKNHSDLPSNFTAAD